MTQNDIISQLNLLLKSQLTGINQYFLHARMLKHTGIVMLADYEYKASIDAMKHADMLVEHILSLGGMPQLQELGALAIGLDANQMMAGDLAHTEDALQLLATILSEAKSQNDQATIALLERIEESQHEHLRFIRRQMQLTHTPIPVTQGQTNNTEANNTEANNKNANNKKECA